MRATVSYIEQKFAEFNALCFDNQLAPLPIRLSRARSFLGKVEYRQHRRLSGSIRYTDFVLVISVSRDIAESLLEDTVLHEMIHYYILSRQLKDTSSHGVIFRRIMNDINQRFGRHISIRHRSTDEEMALDTQRRQHLVCVSTFADGRFGVTLATRSSLALLWDTLPTIRQVVECRWYISYDPFFNRFPRSRTPKIYVASQAELQKHLATAKILIRDGNIFKPCTPHYGTEFAVTSVNNK